MDYTQGACVMVADASCMPQACYSAISFWYHEKEAVPDKKRTFESMLAETFVAK